MDSKALRVIIGASVISYGLFFWQSTLAETTNSIYLVYYPNFKIGDKEIDLASNKPVPVLSIENNNPVLKSMPIATIKGSDELCVQSENSNILSIDDIRKIENFYCYNASNWSINNPVTYEIQVNSLEKVVESNPFESSRSRLSSLTAAFSFTQNMNIL